jgi:hypothetical protein
LVLGYSRPAAIEPATPRVPEPRLAELTSILVTGTTGARRGRGASMMVSYATAMKKPRANHVNTRTTPASRPAQLSMPGLAAVKGALTSLELLALQAQLQQENQLYTMISSVMKTRHDTIKNTIANVR